MKLSKLFDLSGKVAVITGGGGLLGRQHTETVLEAGGTVLLLDINKESLEKTKINLGDKYLNNIFTKVCDITKIKQVEKACNYIIKKKGRVDILINNATNNPKVEINNYKNFLRIENFPLPIWEKDLAVGLTGALVCVRIFAPVMSKLGGGVILNIASDLALISPDQRIYRQNNLPDEEQPVKPVSYSVVKTGLLGFTKYCATYYSKNNIRCNALAPGGIYTDQKEEFVERISKLIPMGRMAKYNEYKGAVLFLISEASSYMTGACLTIDGGRTVW
jgi:NAD(P)-dependent dehydrogenase (short-subunit alcohol dehydrogenase family)